MTWLIPYAVSAAITAVSMVIQKISADDRASQLEKLAGEKLRLQKERATIEKTESERKIAVQARILRANLVNTAAAARGLDVESRETSANLGLQSITSGVKGASSLLDKRFQSLLALQQSDFDIATFDDTPGLAEQLITGALGGLAPIAQGVGETMFKTATAKGAPPSITKTWFG
jgi:VIT1/CCC1 family predicted Fe2+/Mn2+ transporter